MTLVGCFVTPHPPIIVPEVGGRRLAGVMPTVEAMRRVGKEAAALGPEVVVIMSPHAPIDADRMSVGLAERYVGSLSYFGAGQVALDLQGRPALGERIVDEARARGVPADALRGRRELVELDHGSLVPLVFVVGELDPPPALVVLSFSFLDRQTHRRFGQAIGAAIEEWPERVLYVASGDLSHRLTPDAPAGYSPRGAEFDRLVVESFAAEDEAGLLKLAPGLQQDAGECGYRSLVTLFGVLEGRTAHTRVLSYEGPFGVGYLVGAVDLEAAVAAEAGT